MVAAVAVVAASYLLAIIGNETLRVLVISVALAAAIASGVVDRSDLIRLRPDRPWALALLLSLGAWQVIGFADPSGHSSGYFANGLGPLVLGAITEELMFRVLVIGILLPTGSVSAVMVSAVLFGLAHLSNALYFSPVSTVSQMLFSSIDGLTYGSVRLITRSVWPVVVGHLLVNVVGLAASVDPLSPATAGATILKLGLSFATGFIGLTFMRRYHLVESDRVKDAPPRP